MASENNMDRPPCANGCGCFGSVENKNMCLNCYIGYLKEGLITQAVKLFQLLHNPVTSPTPLPDSSSLDDHPTPTATVSATNCLSTTGSTATTTRTKCPCCNKRLRLLGFRCRCGGVFCGEHRYPEKHSCHVDFKEAGREILAKQLPVCKGDKMRYRIR